MTGASIQGQYLLCEPLLQHIHHIHSRSRVLISAFFALVPTDSYLVVSNGQGVFRLNLDGGNGDGSDSSHPRRQFESAGF